MASAISLIISWQVLRRDGCLSLGDNRIITCVIWPIKCVCCLPGMRTQSYTKSVGRRDNPKIN